MASRHDPIWHLRLARDDAAAAVREAVDFCHDTEDGLVPAPDLVIRRRRVAARKRIAFAAWVAEGYRAVLA